MRSAHPEDTFVVVDLRVDPGVAWETPPMDDPPDHDHIPWSPAPRRPSRRWHGFDYRSRRVYFVTPVTHLRICHFGTIENGSLSPSPVGAMVADVWSELPKTYLDVTLDVCVVMPNHVHAMLRLNDDDPDAPQHTLGDAMRWFKTVTTNRYIHGVRDQGWPRFPGKLWQPNYYDHVVRTNADYDRIRAYIEANPMTWERDALNGEAQRRMG